MYICIVSFTFTCKDIYLQNCAFSSVNYSKVKSLTLTPIFLAYNLIRSLMLSSAHYCNLLPRLLSFKHTVQLFFSYRMTCDSLYLLKLIGKKRIGNRPERIEPRAIKKRHNDYPLLMKPRNIAREEIKRNGHPKKLK